MALYSILKQYIACRCVIVDIHTHLDIAFHTQNDSQNNILKCDTQQRIPRNFFGGGSSTNSVEDRGQREWGSGGGSPLVRDSAQFANG
jgi:hypothetical protein